MAEDNGDILEDVSDEDLPKLANMYEEHKEWAPHAYSTITTAIEWKKKSQKTYLQVMSPNNRWRENGTVFVYFREFGSLLIFSLDTTNTSVYKALMETRRLRKLNLFFSVHEMLYPTVRQYIDEKKLTTRDTHGYMFSISRHDALKYTIECPPDIYIKKLDISYAVEINNVWPHKHENSKKSVALLLEMNDAYGIFLKSSDELVAWILLSIMGQLSMLQTKEEHKKKGYGSIITKYMCKELAKRGHNPFGTVMVNNSASISLFKKLGFKSLGRATYIDII